MTRRFFAFWALWAFLVIPPAAPQAPAASKPKLVLGIVIDQFRYDYLTRFRGEYTAGFDRLLRDGAVFTNARYIHFPTVTAIGHATFLTGATPSLSGIVGNEWYDRESGKIVTSVSDNAVALLGGTGPGASPRRLLVSTLGDELKAAEGNSRVFGISIKDRSAILPAGHMADGAFWFDAKTGSFVSSTFYLAALPQWITEFNQTRPADSYLGREWAPLDGGKAFKKIAAAPGPAAYGAIEATPFGNELVEALAERAIDAEQLGRRGVTDLLTVSFSSNDYVGHQVGPDAPEVHDISVRTDRLLGKLFQFVDGRLGLANVVVVLTADHGVAPLPEVNQARKMPGGRLSAKEVLDAIQTMLVDRFGAGDWLVRASAEAPYLNRNLIKQKNLDEGAVASAAADAVSGLPHIFRVYTRGQLLNGAAVADPVSRMVVNGFYPPRAPDLFILPEPYWIFSKTGATHGNVFGFDTHVPIILMGPGIRAGRYDAAAAPNDIAPTLATLLAIETPSGSVGRVLTEALGK